MLSVLSGDKKKKAKETPLLFRGGIPVNGSTDSIQGTNQELFHAEDEGPPVSLDWRFVTYEVDIDLNKKSKKRLVKTQSGRIVAGELTAFMGPSGCGKTSLLNVLVGRIAEGRVYGEILFDGNKRNPATWSRECAFVEQVDIFHPHLTVAETMRFAADFRLDCHLSQDEKDEKIMDILQDLGLLGNLETKVGNEHIPGLSGGEKKRLSVALEMLVSPKILILDEPTTGLDSFTAFNVIQLLRDVAKKRRIAIGMTIHQPRTDLLNLFHKLCLLSAGKCVYFGPTKEAVSHFERNGYKLPPATNPADFYLDIISIDQRTNELLKSSEARIDQLFRLWHVQAKTLYPKLVEREAISSETVERKRSTLLEFKSLLSRSLLTVLRDQTSIKLSFYTAILIGLLMGGLIYQSGSDINGSLARVGTFFGENVFLFSRALNPSLPVFSAEKQISKKERSSNSYSMTAAVLTKWAAQIPVVLTTNLLYVAIMYWMGGFNSSASAFATHLLITIVLTIGALAIGIFVSAAVPSIETAQIIGPLVNVGNSLFAGFAISLAAMPVWIGWMRWFAIISNGMGAMMVNEFTGRILTCTTTGGLCYSTGAQVITAYNFQILSVAAYLFINLGLTVLFLILGIYYFEKMTRPLMKLDTLSYEGYISGMSSNNKGKVAPY